MTPTIPNSRFTPEQLAEIQKAIENAYKGVHDPEAMRQACERMDRTRREIEARHGILDIGVPAIRELRDE